MDTSFTIKPRDTVGRAVHDRASTVRTDIAPSQSVTAAAAVQALRPAGGAAEHARPGVSIDPDTQDVINRVREDREKRRRAPDQALSRMRAYRTAPGTADADPHSHADIEI